MTKHADEDVGEEHLCTAWVGMQTALPTMEISMEILLKNRTTI